MDNAYLPLFLKPSGNYLKKNNKIFKECPFPRILLKVYEKMLQSVRKNCTVSIQMFKFVNNVKMNTENTRNPFNCKLFIISKLETNLSK